MEDEVIIDGYMQSLPGNRLKYEVASSITGRSQFWGSVQMMAQVYSLERGAPKCGYPHSDWTVDYSRPSHLRLPYSRWRNHQLETIRRIVESPSRYIILEAPTGSGKSGIVVGGLNVLDQKDTLLCVQSNFKTNIYSFFGGQWRVEKAFDASIQRRRWAVLHVHPAR